MSEITLRVSVGEALDKLSILAIKLRKIKEEERRQEVIKEFTLLENVLNEHKEKYKFYFKLLCKINESIWDKLEDFRQLELGHENETSLLWKQNKLFKEITDENDDRFRVKNKINVLCDSNLKEQKGYKIKHAFVLSHLGLGDCICMNGLVRYLSTKYDKILVVCRDRYETNLRLIYADDNDIELYPVHSQDGILWHFDKDEFENATKNCDTYLASQHLLVDTLTNLPFNFYDDMKIERSVFWDYHHIPHVSAEKDLYTHLQGINYYIFIHSDTSTGKTFELVDAEKYFNFDSNDVLIINPCENVYDSNHKFYNTANKFINHPLVYYRAVIEKANKIILSDSSFFCFSLCLKTDSKIIYLKARDSSVYSLENLNKINEYVYWQPEKMNL